MTIPSPPSYAGYRFPADIITYAVWLYFRFPLSLRHVDEILAARGIVVSHETVRQWGLKFGQGFANQIRRRLPQAGDKWHLDEVQVKIAGEKHWLWRAVDQDGIVLDVLDVEMFPEESKDRATAMKMLPAAGFSENEGGWELRGAHTGDIYNGLVAAIDKAPRPQSRDASVPPSI